MSAFVSVSPEFKADPRGWMNRMIDRLMAPGIQLQERDRALLVKKRRHYAMRIDLTPGPNLYEQLCRIAKTCGVLPRPPARKKRVDVTPPPVAAPAAQPARPDFALYAPIPKPPPLRRPVVALGGSPSETWDPSVGGL